MFPLNLIFKTKKTTVPKETERDVRLRAVRELAERERENVYGKPDPPGMVRIPEGIKAKYPYPTSR